MLIHGNWGFYCLQCLFNGIKQLLVVLVKLACTSLEFNQNEISLLFLTRLKVQVTKIPASIIVVCKNIHLFAFRF